MVWASKRRLYSRDILNLNQYQKSEKQFVKGKLFELGDTVLVKESDEIGTITYLGTNYVVVELSETRSVRKWLHGVEKVVESNIPTKLKSVLEKRRIRKVDSYK